MFTGGLPAIKMFYICDVIAFSASTLFQLNVDSDNVVDLHSKIAV